MPNWCVGDLKVRGKYKDIKEFLSKELINLGGSVLHRSYTEPTIEEALYGLSVDTGSQGLWFKNMNRSCFESYICIDLDDDNDDETIITANLGELKSAWGVDTESLTNISKQYNLDFKIYAYEKGMEFNIDFEVHSGKVIKYDEIGFDDYVWECTNPSVGG